MRGKKIPPKELNNILKEMVKGYPKHSNVFIVKKVMGEIEKKHGKSLYSENTLIRKLSEFKNSRGRKDRER